MFKKTRMTEQFDEGAFRERYGEKAFVLFFWEADGETLHVVTESQPCLWKPNQRVLALVPPEEDAEGTAPESNRSAPSSSSSE